MYRSITLQHQRTVTCVTAQISDEITSTLIIKLSCQPVKNHDIHSFILFVSDHEGP